MELIILSNILFLYNNYMDYYKKYQKYKIKYLELLQEIKLNDIHHIGGKQTNNSSYSNESFRRKALENDINNMMNKYDSLLLNDLIEINQNISLQYSKENAIKRENEFEQINKKLIKKEMKRMIDQKEKIDETKIFNLMEVKYDINVKLEDRYLDKYNMVIKNMVLSNDLYKCGFYEYVFKLKQYLNKCGINRTTQLYGTCWFNTTINGIIFGSKMRGRLIQLLLHYKNSLSEKEFNKIINDINKQKYKLVQNIDNNQQNIFYHIICILYKTLCQEGLRNKNPSKYENFSLTNLAINMKYLFSDSKKINVKNLSEIAYIPIYGINLMIYILNKFIDEKPHIIIYKDELMNELNSFSNLNHINMLYFDDINDNIKIHAGYEYKDLMFKNITIDIDSNGIKKTYKFKDGENINNLHNVDFLVMAYENKNIKKIPHEITCIVNNKKTLFKLDFATIGISTPENEISHVVTGLICNNNYYIYDSAEDLYLECNWTDLSTKNNIIKPLNYYQVMSSDYIFYTEDIKNTSGKFFKLYNKSSLKKFDFDYRYAIYYNTHLDFSYDIINCNPKRI